MSAGNLVEMLELGGGETLHLSPRDQGGEEVKVDRGEEGDDDVFDLESI